MDVQPLDVAPWVTGAGMCLAFLLALMKAAFRPRDVDWRVQVWFQTAFALGMVRVFLVNVDPRPVDWWSVSVWAHLAVASAALLVAIIRAADRTEAHGATQRAGEAEVFDAGVIAQRNYGRGTDDETAYQQGRSDQRDRTEG